MEGMSSIGKVVSETSLEDYRGPTEVAKKQASRRAASLTPSVPCPGLAGLSAQCMPRSRGTRR